MPGSHTTRRLACLQPSATVILDAIGEARRVVACTRDCADVVPEVAGGPRGQFWPIHGLPTQPRSPPRQRDLVIASVPYQGKAVSEILRAGARGFSAGLGKLWRIFSTISQPFAGAVGAMDRGDMVISAMPCQIDEVCTRTGGARSPRVWCWQHTAATLWPRLLHARRIS
jgi:hypothetical protein